MLSRVEYVRVSLMSALLLIILQESFHKDSKNYVGIKHYTIFVLDSSVEDNAKSIDY